MSSDIKFTTFIDKGIGLDTRRQSGFKPALTLLADLYSAYLYAPKAPRAYAKLEGMDKFLYFDPGHCPEYQEVGNGFERAGRVENHIYRSYNALASVDVEFYRPGKGQTPHLRIHGVLGRSGTFCQVHWTRLKTF